MKPAQLKRKIGDGLGLLLPALLVLPPLAWLAAAIVATPFSPRGAGLYPLAWMLLQRSLALSLGTCVLALAIGWPFGWFVSRYRVPGRRFLVVASLGPLLLPPYAASHAWAQLFTRDSALNGLLFHWGWVRAPILPIDSPWMPAPIFAFAYWPIVAWFVIFAARSVPAELEDSARLHLADAAAARWAVGPALWRALPAALLLVYLLSLADFGVPNYMGLKTYPVLIVDRFQTTRYPGDVARLALPLLCLVLPLVVLQLRCLAQTPLAPTGDGPAKALISRQWGVLGGFFCFGWLAVTFVLPLALLIRESLPASTYPAVWAESQDHFLNTLVVTGGGALASLSLALAYGWFARGRRLFALDLALSLPYALPGSLIGVAVIQLLNRPGLPEWLYGSLLSLVWTYVALFFAFVLKSLQPAWASVDPHLLEDAEMLGAGAWTRFSTAAWPVLRPHAAAGAVIVAVLAAREIDATALIRVPGGDTVAFRIQDYLHFAPGPNVAALCVILVALSALVAGGVTAWAWKE